jgi:hypothetical protein
MESHETRICASEVKFLVDSKMGEEIERWSRRWLSPDPHGARYQVTSLYFDTPDRDVFQRNGSFARGKYRVRRYNDSNTVFLERKLRANQVVTKRRSLVDVDDLPLLESHTLDRNWQGGYWFHRRLQARNLHPAWQISYSRTARVLETKFGLIRLTLDRELSAMPARHFSLDSKSEGIPLFENDQRILELKFRNRMPTLFRDLMQELVLMPQPVSKFRLAAGALAYA